MSAAVPNQSLPAFLAQSLRPVPVGVGLSEAVRVVVGMVLAEDEEDLVLVAEVALVMVLGAEMSELEEMLELEAVELGVELAVEVWVVEKEVEWEVEWEVECEVEEEQCADSVTVLVET